MSINLDDNESLLFTLAKRLLSGSSRDDLQLLVGQLPSALPVDLPLPQNHQLLGSMVRQQQITIVFDTEETPQQIFRFYRSNLRPQGWQEFEYLSRAGGFQQAMPNDRLFCREEQDPALIIHAFDRSEQPTQVRLVLQSDRRNSPCTILSQPSSYPKLLPDLLAPPQASQEGGGAAQGRRYSQSKIILETNLALLDVAAHYEAQLSAEWRLEQRGHDGPLAWSMWSFSESGQECRGLLVVIRTQENPQEYFLLVRADL